MGRHIRGAWSRGLFPARCYGSVSFPRSSPITESPVPDIGVVRAGVGQRAEIETGGLGAGDDRVREPSDLISIMCPRAGGAKVRRPYDALPPADPMQAALQARGIVTERHPFSVF